MNFPNVARLAKFGEKANELLPYAIWSSSETTERPESILPFDPTKEYQEQSLIDIDGNMFQATTKPTYTLPVPVFNSSSLANTNATARLKTFKVKGETFLLTVSPSSSPFLDRIGATAHTSAPENVKIFKWSDTSLDFTLISTIVLDATDVEVVEREDFVSIYPSAPTGTDPGAEVDYYTFDGVVTTSAGKIPAYSKIYHFEMNEVEYLVCEAMTDGTMDVIRLYADAYSKVSSVIIPDGLAFKAVKFSIVSGVMYLLGGTAPIANDGSNGTLEIQQWDAYGENFEPLRTETNGAMIDVNLIELSNQLYAVLVTEQGFLEIYKYEDFKIQHVSTSPTVANYIGEVVTIVGKGTSIESFDEDGISFVNVTFYTAGSRDSSYMVSYIWDPVSLTLNPGHLMPATNPADMVSWETSTGRYMAMAYYYDINGAPTDVRVHAWSSTYKKYDVYAPVKAGGTIWELSDWTEMKTSIAFVDDFEETRFYGYDHLVLKDSKLYMTKASNITGAWDSSLWTEVESGQVIKTAHIYPEGQVLAPETKSVVSGHIVKFS